MRNFFQNIISAGKSNTCGQRQSDGSWRVTYKTNDGANKGISESGCYSVNDDSNGVIKSWFYEHQNAFISFPYSPGDDNSPLANLINTSKVSNPILDAQDKTTTCIYYRDADDPTKHIYIQRDSL